MPLSVLAGFVQYVKLRNTLLQASMIACGGSLVHDLNLHVWAMQIILTWTFVLNHRRRVKGPHRRANSSVGIMAVAIILVVIQTYLCKPWTHDHAQ